MPSSPIGPASSSKPRPGCKYHVFPSLLHTLHPALEDGTDRRFRNVGKPQSDAGEIPKRIRTTLVFTPHFTLKLPTRSYERPPFLTLSLHRVVIICIEAYQCVCSIRLVVMIIKEVMCKSLCRYYVFPWYIQTEFSAFRSRENPISPVNNNEETEEWIYQWNQVLNITVNCNISFSFLSSSLCACTILTKSLGIAWFIHCREC